MIPDFQTLMLPLLKAIGDNQEHAKKDLVEYLSNVMQLSDEEKREMLPSRNQPVFYNRVTWAIAHFKAAKLIENTRRGFIKIAPLGQDTLNKNPSAINLKYLKQLPTYIDAINSWKNKTAKEEPYSDKIVEEKTPLELLEDGYLTMRNKLKQDILERIKAVHPQFFERLVLKLLVKMGYGVEHAETTKYTNDEGIDGILKEDKLGLDVIYIQAKRWEGSIPRPEIQKFVGALAGQKAKKGVFITSSGFSKEAIAYASQMETKVVLIDGEQLADYMIDYNLGVTIESIYEIKKLDSSYFDEEE